MLLCVEHHLGVCVFRIVVLLLIPLRLFLVFLISLVGFRCPLYKFPSMVAHGAQVNPGTTVSSEIKGQEIVTEKYTLFDKKVLGPNDPKNYNNPTEWASSSDYMGLGMNVYYKADSESYTTEGVATNLQKIFPDLDWENNGEMLLNLYLGGYQDELQNIVLQMIEKENLRRKYTEKTYNELYFEEGYQLLEGDGLKGYGLTFLKDVNFDSLDSFIDQFQKIANTYQMIDDNWLANTLQKFHTSLGSLDQESVTKALNIFMQMDLKSLDSIIYAKQTLEGLGVPEETLNTMEEMIVDLREFGIALQRIDLEVVIKQIEDLNKIVNKINKMEIDTNLTFSEEEYTAMISSGGFLQEEFVSTMDGFVYLGGTMTELRETLVKTNQILLDNQVEALRKKMKYVEGIEESGLQGKTWGSVATWDMGVIKDVVKEGLTNAGFNITEDGKIKYNENEINLESSKDIALMSTLLEGTILEGIDYETLSEIVSNGALQNSTVEGVKEFFKEVGDAWVNRITYENQLETGVTKIKQETLSGLTAQEMLDMIGQTDSHGYTYTADDIDAVLKARSQQEGTTIAGYQKGSQILESEARQAYDQVLTSGGSEAKAEEAYNDYINNKDNVDKANRLGQALALDANMNINQYKSLISIFDKYSGAVTKAKRGTEEYAQGVSKLQTAFQNAYGIELSSQFMLQHAALLEQVLAGEEGAWERWADAMAEETARGMNASMKNAVAGASEMVIAVDSIVKTISPTIGVTTTFNGEGLKNAQLGLQELGGQIVATQGQLNSMAALYDILGATIEFETATGWLVNGTMVIGDEMPNGAASGPYTVVTGTTVTNTGNDLDSYAPSSASEEWENPYDEFYNSVKKINAELRKRESLEREYERLLKRNAGTMEEMTAYRRAQIESLQNELGQRETLKSNREKQMDDIQREYSDVSKYAWYDKTLGQVQIDWEELEKLEGSTDSDYTERVEEYISALEEQQGLIEEEVDAIEDIKDRVYDIYEENKDDYLDLEERIKEALIDARQKEIDELSAINDSINQANSDLLSAMQEQINEYRQNRDNEKTEKEISDKQRRLAYLQQDTSGVYDLEILQLQKEIDESTEDYTDTLVDQKISELQQQNDKAAQQREDQIRIAQAQLDQWVDSGAIWTEVNRLLAQGFGPESELIKVLQNSDSFSGMSHIEKMDWLNDLETSVNTALSWLELGAMQSLYKKGEQIKFATKNGVEMTGVVNEDGNVEVRDAEGNLTHLFGQESFSMDPSGKVTTSQHAIEGWVAAAKSTWDETPESSPSEGGSLSLDGVDNTDKAVANAIWQLGTNSGWGNGSERTKKLKEALGANNKVQWIINNFLANDQKVPYEGDLSKFTYESLTKTEEPEEHGYLALDGQKFETLEEAQQAVRKWYNDALADLLDRIAHGEGGNSQGYKSWAMAELAKKYEYYRSSITAYKTGGLVDFTGLAWLDGTKSDPEYVLNAKQTKEFLANDGDVTNVKPEKTKPHTKTTEEPEALDVVKKKPKLQAFKTGGLADFTGPAWLDGTKAKPEYILNADQTKAFFTLVDVLGALQYKESKASQNNGDNTYDIDINVESIGSDYDVEQLANTVKRLINEDARYRNNNAINLMR